MVATIADIFFTDLERKAIHQLPILPAVMPQLNESAENEEFRSFNNGTYNLLGNVGLTTFNISSFLPEYAGKYSFAKSKMDPYLLINMWRSAMKYKTPLRCIMQRSKTSSSPEILNWTVTVENLTWNENKTHDVEYQVSFKKYKVIE
ncbi:MAG: hypothetical protein ACJAX4_002445 [Clostridium sp.]